MPENPWEPFNDEVSFCLASLLFTKVKMSQPNIDELLDLWYLDVSRRFNGSLAPFGNHNDLLQTIDAIKDGSAPWCCFQTEIEPNLPRDAPEWQKTSYQVWYHDPDTVIANILANGDFAAEFDPAPYIHIDQDGQHRWSDMMSGNFAYRHAVSDEHFLLLGSFFILCRHKYTKIRKQEANRSEEPCTARSFLVRIKPLSQ